MVMTEQPTFEGVRALFEQALRLPPEYRAAFLDDHCSPDTALRARVDGLLAAAGRPGLTDDESPIGRTIVNFSITKLLGRGGMGRVYHAIDNRLGRHVAIKVLDAGATDSHLAARFRREARILASLNHPNIAAIHDVEEHDDQLWLILEYIKGRTLAQRLVEGPLPVPEAIAIARRISRALGTAHAQGVIHRDLKPGNVMLDAGAQVKVLDFGIAKTVRSDGLGTEPSHDDQLAETQEGQLIGTLGYMSPESLRGFPADRRVDIWAFGIVLFEMLAGRAPFDSADAALTLARVLESEPQWRLLPADVPHHLRWLI
jgi:serine/threonine-protein kinase